MVVFLWCDGCTFAEQWCSQGGIHNPHVGSSPHLHHEWQHASHLICRCSESREVSALSSGLSIDVYWSRDDSNNQYECNWSWQAAGPLAHVSSFLVAVFIRCMLSVWPLIHSELILWQLDPGSTPPCTLRVPQRGTHFSFNRAAFISQNQTPPLPPTAL